MNLRATLSDYSATLSSDGHLVLLAPNPSDYADALSEETNESGEVLFESVSPGRYDLIIPGSEAPAVRIEVPAGEGERDAFDVVMDNGKVVNLGRQSYRGKPSRSIRGDLEYALSKPLANVILSEASGFVLHGKPIVTFENCETSIRGAHSLLASTSLGGFKAAMFNEVEGAWRLAVMLQDDGKAIFRALRVYGFTQETRLKPLPFSSQCFVEQHPTVKEFPHLFA